MILDDRKFYLIKTDGMDYEISNNIGDKVYIRSGCKSHEALEDILSGLNVRIPLSAYVVCIKEDKNFKKGKIYRVNNGYIFKNENVFNSVPIFSMKDLNSIYSADFIEVTM